MFEHPILGDPLTQDKKGHYSLDWHNFLACDQLAQYTNLAQENQHANEQKGWEEHLEQIKNDDRKTDLSVRWWEYRGKACKDGVKAPLIVCLYEYFNTSWQHVADREGLVVIAFEYHRNQRNPEGGLGALGFGPKDDEIEAYDIVIERAIEKYDCDRERVYMNGLSFGDFSSLTYASRYTKKLAGLASVNGPIGAYNLQRYGFNDIEIPALPCLQIRSDDDFTCDGFPAGYAFSLEGNEEWIRHIRSQQVILNRDIWIKANKCKLDNPVIYTDGKRAFIRYEGEKCDVIYAEYNKHCHIAPVDNAEVMWTWLYSRYRRNANGDIEEIKPEQRKDEQAIALIAGEKAAYINNKKMQLSAPCLIFDPYPEKQRLTFMYLNTEASYSSFYAPVELLKLGFGVDYKYEKSDLTMSAYKLGTLPEEISFEDGIISFESDGKQFKIYTNTTIAEVDGKITTMDRPSFFFNGVLMIPVCEMAALLGWFATERNDAVYVGKRRFEMGYTLTRMLREEILPAERYVPLFKVKKNQSIHGGYTLSNDSFRRGETLKISLAPELGYKVESVKASMNGVSVLVNKISDCEYWVCNMFGDVELDVTFVKE